MHDLNMISGIAIITKVVFSPFYQPLKSQLLGTKCVFIHKICKCFVAN